MKYDHRLIAGYFPEQASILGDERFACVFADPPDNIGLKYDDVSDRASPEVYRKFLYDSITYMVDVADTVWVSFNAKWTAEMFSVARCIQQRKGNADLSTRLFVQNYSFGQHNSYDFGGGFRPILRLQRVGAPFYADNVRVESVRQKIGDSRANPNGRVPSDSFDFPRVTGNSRQRRSWHPTQLHEGLVSRCVLSCTAPGDVVLDPFAGTGTVLRVCLQSDRRSVSFDASEVYIRTIAQENGFVKTSNLPTYAIY